MKLIMFIIIYCGQLIEDRAPNLTRWFGYPTRPDPKFLQKLFESAISTNIAPIGMILLPLDSSHQDESNDSKIIPIRAIFMEIL